MKLKTRFMFLMTLIFFAFMLAIWIYSEYLVTKINEQWGLRLADKQVLFDKNRTLQPLLREISLAKQLASDPAILELALHEEDGSVRQRALVVLEQYRLKFQDRSYFAGVVKSGHYYFNDAAHQFDGKQLRYTLLPDKSVDAWFFATVAARQDYQINVDPDEHLGNTKVWINVSVKKADQVVAVIGTGIAISDFLQSSVGVVGSGIHNLFIDRDMAIQLHEDRSLIDYASLTKSVDQHRKVDVLLTDALDIEHLRSAMRRLESAPGQVETLWVTYAGKKMLLGVAYLPEVGWFDLTVMDGDSLNILQGFNFISIFTLLFLLGLISAAVMLHRLVLKPLHSMALTMEQIEIGNYDVEVPLLGTGEIAKLSAQFKHMIQVVRDSKFELENKVEKRTLQLSRELIESERAKKELDRSETLLRTLYDTTSDAIMLLNETGFFNCNRAALALFGVADNEVFYSKHPGDLSPALQPNGECSLALSNQHIASALAQGGCHFEWLHRRLDNGQTFFADVVLNSMQLDGETVLQAVVRDVSTRKFAEDQIRQLAFYDTLTNLPNRRLLNDRLIQALAISKRNGLYGALMFLDLDNFKPLNDTHGHVVGDLLLIEAANRIKSCVREMDTVARFGGDEFVVMLSGLKADKTGATSQALLVAEKVLAVLSSPYLLIVNHDEGLSSMVTHRCTASIGVAMFVNHEGSQEEILQWADLAMYQAKDAGRNSIHLYSAVV